MPIVADGDWDFIYTDDAGGTYNYTLSLQGYEGFVSIYTYTGTASHVDIAAAAAAIGTPIALLASDMAKNNTNIQSINIPDSVMLIGGAIFKGCTNLTTITVQHVTLPPGLSRSTEPAVIGAMAFLGCTSLTSVTISPYISIIDAYAFKDCTSLTTITIPAGFTEIAVGAFEGCTALKNVLFLCPYSSSLVDHAILSLYPDGPAFDTNNINIQYDSSVANSWHAITHINGNTVSEFTTANLGQRFKNISNGQDAPAQCIAAAAAMASDGFPASSITGASVYVIVTDYPNYWPYNNPGPSVVLSSYQASPILSALGASSATITVIPFVGNYQLAAPASTGYTYYPISWVATFNIAGGSDSITVTTGLSEGLYPHSITLYSMNSTPITTGNIITINNISYSVIIKKGIFIKPTAPPTTLSPADIISTYNISNVSALNPTSIAAAVYQGALSAIPEGTACLISSGQTSALKAHLGLIGNVTPQMKIIQPTSTGNNTYSIPFIDATNTNYILTDATVPNRTYTIPNSYDTIYVNSTVDTNVTSQTEYQQMFCVNGSLQSGQMIVKGGIYTITFMDGTTATFECNVVGTVSMTPQTGAGVGCFLKNAPVLTPAGYRRIDSLKVGDLVQTAKGPVAIQAVKMWSVTASASVNPFVIPKGRLGATRDLMISPDHKVEVDGAMIEARFLGLIQKTMKGTIDYYNIELPDHENMTVAGVVVESQYPIRRVVVTMAEFRQMLVAKYGTLTPAILARVQKKVRILGGGRVEVPVDKR